jgi:aspartate racemase
MRAIGLIGGTSWESTAVYYAMLNRGTAARRGPRRQPVIHMHSVDFAEVAELQAAGRWDLLGDQYAEIANALVSAGAEVLGICANTMHLVADRVVEAVDGRATLVHVIDATAAAAHGIGTTRVALLGTAYTMEMPFYSDGLVGHGLDVVIPGQDDRAQLQSIIYDELIQGIVLSTSRRFMLDLVARLADQGAQAALLACTELQMLAEPGDNDSTLPLIDTTREHCDALLAAALSDN